MKPVMDERVIWFAYHKDKPICIFCKSTWPEPMVQTPERKIWLAA
jgi:hypothetical protein